MYFDFVYGMFLTHEKNQPRIGANLASLWLALRIGFADPHSRTLGHIASLSTCSAEVVRFQRPTRYGPNGSSLIGSVRANPVGAPAPLMREIFR
ncbi:MAG TPA: hypothetical protein O0W87_02770 [Methanocorpusculum sp.]|nr:hypothetical protein [Methanocorpusculum sp.]